MKTYYDSSCLITLHRYSGTGERQEEQPEIFMNLYYSGLWVIIKPCVESITPINQNIV
jgi:hypothetical protein